MGDAFFEAVKRSAPASVRERLREAEVNAWRARAAKAWPGLDVPVKQFAEHVGRNLESAAADAIVPEDVVLALACLDGQKPALEALDAMLRRMHKDPEVVQRARERLLVGRAPRLSQYAGRSPLKAWLKLVVKRLAVDVARAEGPLGRAAPATLAAALRATPEVSLMRRDGARRVTLAVEQALASLDARDRMLLRAYHFDGETHAELGKRLGAPRSSVAHWLEQARARVLARTRELLKESAGLESRELDSLLRAVESHLDLSFSELKR